MRIFHNRSMPWISIQVIRLSFRTKKKRIIESSARWHPFQRACVGIPSLYANGGNRTWASNDQQSDSNCTMYDAYSHSVPRHTRSNAKWKAKFTNKWTKNAALPQSAHEIILSVSLPRAIFSIWTLDRRQWHRIQQIRFVSLIQVKVSFRRLAHIAVNAKR